MLVSVNLAVPHTFERRGETHRTGIFKQPASGPVRVLDVSLEGDFQADLRVHGGAHQAVYAYATEDAAWWSAELGREVAPGMFGENLTVSGTDVSGALVGERWRVGSAVLEVSAPRIPCWKLGRRFEDPKMVKRFAAASRPGAYLRVIERGSVCAGDPVEVVARPEHAVTVRLIADARNRDTALAPSILAAGDALPPAWAQWAREWEAKATSL